MGCRYSEEERYSISLSDSDVAPTIICVALSGRGEAWSVAKLLSVLFISEYTLLNVVHGSVHALVVFFWSEKFEILLFRYLYVYAQTVGIESRSFTSSRLAPGMLFRWM